MKTANAHCLKISKKVSFASEASHIYLITYFVDSARKTRNIVANETFSAIFKHCITSFSR